MFCSQCGKQIPDHSTLCEHCGSPIIIHTKRETSVNNEETIQKTETHQSMSKRILIVWVVILLIVGLFVYLFFFEKSESDKPVPPVKTLVPKSTDVNVVPVNPNETVIPESTDKTLVPKSTDETVVSIPPAKTVIPKSTDETVAPIPPVQIVTPKSTDETPVPQSADETVAPTPPSSSSD